MADTIDPTAEISPMTVFLFSGTLSVLFAFTVPFLSRTAYGMFGGGTGFKAVLWILIVLMVGLILYTLFITRPQAENDLEIDWINLGLSFIMPIFLVLIYAFYSMATYTDTTKVANLITTTLGAITKAANITLKVNTPTTQPVQPLVVIETPTTSAATGGGRRSRKLHRRR